MQGRDGCHLDVSQRKLHPGVRIPESSSVYSAAGLFTVAPLFRGVAELWRPTVVTCIGRHNHHHQRWSTRRSSGFCSDSARADIRAWGSSKGVAVLSDCSDVPSEPSSPLMLSTRASIASHRASSWSRFWTGAPTFIVKGQVVLLQVLAIYDLQIVLENSTLFRKFLYNINLTGALATRNRSALSAAAKWSSSSFAAAAANADTGDTPLPLLVRHGMGMPPAPMLLEEARRRRSAATGEGVHGWPSKLPRRACRRVLYSEFQLKSSLFGLSDTSDMIDLRGHSLLDQRTVKIVGKSAGSVAGTAERRRVS